MTTDTEHALADEVAYCVDDLKDMKRRGLNSLDARGYSRDAMLALQSRLLAALRAASNEQEK